MSRRKACIFAIISIALCSIAGGTHANDITSKKDCEAADGMAKRVGGVLTCTLPLLESEMRVADKHLTTCPGEIVSGGSFCQIIINTKRKKSKLNCKAFNTQRQSTGETYEAWRMEADTPMSDAWKCERRRRIKAQHARAK